MKTITHFCEYLNTINTLSFILKKHLEPLLLLDELPPKVEDIFSDQTILHLFEQATHNLASLNDLLKPHVKTIIHATTKKKSSSNKMTPYADFRVDGPPIVVTPHDEPVQLQFDDYMYQAHAAGKTIKPIKRKKQITYDGNCPHCNASCDYLYDNTGKGNQFFCKVCKNTFTLGVSPQFDVGFYCPYCKCKLERKHERSNYDVFICSNKKCSFYLDNKLALDSGEAEHLLTSSNQYNLHYHYRHFNFTLDSLKDSVASDVTKVNLSKIHCDEYALGLILTYYVNYGLSARKTALIMSEIHNLRISHQTVMNYANAVSAHIKPFIDNYQYDNLSDTLTGDETYIHVRSKNHYVFFFSDPKSKIITSHEICSLRDTEAACRAIAQSLHHYKSIPENLKIITDGNPIYNAAQLFFSMHHTYFDLIQVIGVSNKDDISALYRPFKQIEERLNRTYKQNYYGTNGYDKLSTANAYMTNYVAFFNFLRKHSALNFKSPALLDCLLGDDLMPDKWLKLINFASAYKSA